MFNNWSSIKIQLSADETTVNRTKVLLSVYAVLGQPMYLKIKFPVKTSIETFRGVHLGAINTMSINYYTCMSVLS